MKIRTSRLTAVVIIAQFIQRYPLDRTDEAKTAEQ